MNKQNKARVETIMMNAHTEGNGIKTALIPVDLCELSPIYQRDQGRHVAHIASNWDDNKAGHLEASERGDHFNIWDGGNRLRAAVMVVRHMCFAIFAQVLQTKMKRTCL